MALAEDMEKIVDQIVSSYEARIENIGTLFDTTHQILRSFQDSLLDTKQEREKLNAELRENLAKNRSFRRKDFDKMMQGIVLTQDEREKEVRNLLNGYLGGQKEMTQDVRNNLERFKDSLIRGETRRLREFQEMIREIFFKQEERKDEVTSKLKEFKKEQIALTSRLKELLAKGKELRVRDFKSLLKEVRTCSKERLTCQEERRKEVRQLLGEFKKERTEAMKSWQMMQNRLAHGITIPTGGKLH